MVKCLAGTWYSPRHESWKNKVHATYIQLVHVRCNQPAWFRVPFCRPEVFPGSKRVKRVFSCVADCGMEPWSRSGSEFSLFFFIVLNSPNGHDFPPRFRGCRNFPNRIFVLFNTPFLLSHRKSIPSSYVHEVPTMILDDLVHLLREAVVCIFDISSQPPYHENNLQYWSEPKDV